MTSPPNYVKLIYKNMTSPPKNASCDLFRWCTKRYRTIATSLLCIVHCAGSLYLPSKCHLTVHGAICECNMIHRQTLGLCFANWWLWTSSVLCMFIIMLEDQTSNCAQDIIVWAPNTLDAKSYWMVHNYERPYQMQLWWYSCADLSKVSKLYSNRCTMYMPALHTMFHQSIFSLCELPHYVLNTTSIGAQMRLIRMVQHYTNQCANLLFIWYPLLRAHPISCCEGIAMVHKHTVHKPGRALCGHDQDLAENPSEDAQKWLSQCTEHKTLLNYCAGSPEQWCAGSWTIVQAHHSMVRRLLQHLDALPIGWCTTNAR